MKTKFKLSDAYTTKQPDAWPWRIWNHRGALVRALWRKLYRRITGANP